MPGGGQPGGATNAGLHLAAAMAIRSFWFAAGLMRVVSTSARRSARLSAP